MDDLFSQTQTEPPTAVGEPKPKQRYSELKADFMRIFGEIIPGKHRYEVFRDFVFCGAAALHNAINRTEAIEEEYLTIIKRYEKPDQERIANLLAILVMMLEFEPRDVLGELYMGLDIGNKDSGQFFTPQHVSDLMAEMNFDPLLFEDKPFVKLSEPACGAGGMILAFVKEMLKAEINPKDRLFVEAVDIDRNVALMCYIQLALWHVPARVLVGNTLTLEYSEVWYTPAYFLERWQFKLAKDEVDQTDLDPVELSHDELEIPAEVFEAESDVFPEPEDFEEPADKQSDKSKAEEYELRWRDEVLKITWIPEWLRGTIAHLEIRVESGRKTPITNTGYRSHFCPREEVEEMGGPVAYVQAWLEELDDGKPVQFELF